MAGDTNRKSVTQCGVGAESNKVPCCRVEALVSIDPRGQILLPKDLRDRANLQAGDKIAVIAFESKGEICCMTLIKAEALVDNVREMLGPIMTEMSQE